MKPHAILAVCRAGYRRCFVGNYVRDSLAANDVAADVDWLYKQLTLVF
jgi:hypothetical protein